VVRDPPVARDTPTDFQPRDKSKNKRSLTSNVTPTPLYLHRHPYTKTTHIQAVTTDGLSVNSLLATKVFQVISPGWQG